MSHGKERKEKDCLNCGSVVKGHFCHICGQQNLEPQETVWDLISHFVYDITHFDGKFFDAIKYLLFRPGFLSKEYMRGRRAAYLNPVRMYVFTSAFFFLVVFSATRSDDVINLGDPIIELEKERVTLLEQLKHAGSIVEINEIKSEIAENDSLILKMEAKGIIEKSAMIPDSVRKRIMPGLKKSTNILDFGVNLAPTLASYDSAQQALPSMKRDGWVKKYFKRKIIQLNIKYHNRGEELKERFAEKFLHSIPKMMFVSLPLVAFFLWVLYARRKRFYYVNHAIHVIHIYIAIYLIILFMYLMGWLNSMTHWSVFSWINVVAALYCFYYVYKSMRNFYEQGRGKTILKYFIFFILVFFLFAFLSVGFVVNSFLEV